MKKIYLKNLGLVLSEEQIENLVANARNLRNENIILRDALKEVSA